MTQESRPAQVRANPHRFRMTRAGVLNVWQYDDQVFDLADGRLLLRGANGAGKSKTLEMLLPFVLDGDKLRMTASGRHHTSLIWLMTDGYDGNRTGYLWVEFHRTAQDGDEDVLTCGVGVRGSSSAKSATAWFFTCPRRVGTDLLLEDESGPLTRERCRAAVAADGHFFEQARPYREHVGRALFGLEAAQYDELLRLLYWLRDPQVGEDIEPTKLAVQLAQALPQVDEDAVRAAGVTFDELTAFGEQIERRQRAADGIATFAHAYAAYATGILRSRAGELVEAHREHGRRATARERARAAAADASTELAAAEDERSELERTQVTLRARVNELERSPEARSQQRLLELEARALELERAAAQSQTNAGREAARARETQRRITDERGAVLADVSGYASRGSDHVAFASRIGIRVPVALPTALVEPSLDLTQAAHEGAARIGAAVEIHAFAVASLGPAAGERLAAVKVVDAARIEAEAAADQAVRDEERASEAESRAERERGRHEDAAQAVRVAETSFTTAVDQWRAERRGVPFEPPELTAQGVTALASVARAAAGPELADLSAAEAKAGAARIAADAQLASLRARRSAIESERDPAPAPPSLARSSRDGLDGAPLWQLVDFAGQVDDAQRAGLEAALESSGLLDAWVRPDGSLWGGDRLDIALPLGAAVAGAPTLTSVLVPDGSRPSVPVPADVVAGVLARVAVGSRSGSGLGASGDSDAGASGAFDADASGSEPGSGMAPTAAAVVDSDGSWRLGPLVGRAAKAKAQYIGATARAAERARRLAALDAEREEQERLRASAADRQAAARARRVDLESWLGAAPPAQALLTAWTVADERAENASRAQSLARSTAEAAAKARSAARRLRDELTSLADRHGLPVTRDGLATRREELRTLTAALAAHVSDTRRLGDRLTRWVGEWRRWMADLANAEELRAAAELARHTADQVAAQAAEVRAAAGAGIQELQARLRRARDELTATNRKAQANQSTRDGRQQRVGETGNALRNAQEHLREHEPVTVDAAHGLAGLGDVAGLLASGLGRPVSPQESALLELARGAALGARTPGKVLELARTLAALQEPARAVDTPALFATMQAAASSDAADYEPRLVPGPREVLAALGRDEGGDQPVGVLAERLAAAVAQDRELLTERERALFEEHLLGDLGELLRHRRLEAADLVESMNQLLTGVTTSQGISVRLQWKLRDDVSEDARRAVTLLGKPVGALLPGERADLRDALHRLIESSRAEAPEDSYAEHLSRALDYRAWYAFHVRYTRPELKGEWHQLHRRTPLSQGEQKVVCYLPLFAAAAAHFTSLAGAAPHAPRFVLLDDAFPKIDVRTHPLLFGLLVDLDLDFVITSERLWGDHATVPSLAIYEALRDPAERGIAQYRYLWDGARLQAVGA